ncbi:MAG: tetratricopeptide repeat protein [Ilumatobacteraceae bacterium]
MHVALLERFSVSVTGTIVPDGRWRTNKARQLVKVLALAPGHRMHREELTDLLWPDADTAAAGKNLRTALHAARVALEPDRAAGSSSFLVVVHDIVRLTAPGGVTTDVEAFRGAAEDCRRRGTIEAFEGAVAMYPGDLLPADRYEDWAASPRELLRESWLSLLVELADLCEHSGDLARGIAVLERAIAAAPSHEDAHARLMRLHALAGRPGQALRQYARLRAALARELDVEPMHATARLHADIASGRFGPTGDVGARVAKPTGTSLPTPLDRLIGRHAEIGDVESLLTGSRLVSITGAGGSGKTRLAIEVAHRAAEAGRRAVWFVDLAATSDPTLVATAVAAAVGASGPPDQPIVDAIADAVGNASALVVLDNCEHVVEAAAELGPDLLRRCPELRVLATSRQALRVVGETAWRIPALSMPVTSAAAVTDADVAALAESDAIALLVDRIRQVAPGFTVTTTNAVALAEICRRLDGIPLAIELAAARTVLLSPEQLADRVGDALTVLTGGRRSAPDRQRTLRATLDWSHALLDHPAAVLFRRLAVFAGGWTLDAAEDVCAGTSKDRLAAPAVLEALGQLVDSSMVVADDVISADGARAGVRYRMLETIRQYANERLADSGERSFVRDRHLDHQIRLAEESERALTGPDQVAWLHRLEREHDNLRAGLRWAQEEDDVDGEVRLAAPLWRFWNDGDHLVEGAGRLAAAITHAEGADLPPLLRGRLMHGAAALAWTLGDLERAGMLATAALASFRSTGDRFRIGATLHLLGIIAEVKVRNDAARRHYEEALTVRLAVGDTAGAAATLQNLGNIARNERDPARAARFYERSLQMSRASGNERGVAMSLANLGAVALDVDDYDAAERYAREAIEMYSVTNSRSPRAVALQTLGFACLSRGRPDEALAAQQECLRIGDEIGDQRAIALGLEGVAAVLGLVTAHSMAARSAWLLGAAEALRIRDEMPLPDNDAKSLAAPIGHARALLGQEPYELERAAGHRLALADAVALGLTAEIAPPDAGSGRSAAARLTRRERQIAELVAEGLTNGAIAARLGIAPRTADTHVGNVLRKLGAPSRTAIGALLRPPTHT